MDTTFQGVDGGVTTERFHLHLEHIIPVASTEEILSVAYDDEFVYAGTSDGVIQIVDKKTGAVVDQLQGHDGSVNCLACYGDFLYSGSDDKSIIVWNKYSWRVAKRLFGHNSWITSLAADDSKIYSGSFDGTLKFWERQSGNLLLTQIAHDKSINCVHVDAKRIFTASSDNKVKIWDRLRGTLIKEYSHKDNVQALWVDNQKLYSGSYDRAIQIFDLESMRYSGELKAANWVYSVHVKDDIVYAGLYDGTVQVFNLRHGWANAVTQRFSLVATSVKDDVPNPPEGSRKVNSLFVERTGRLYSTCASSPSIQSWKLTLYDVMNTTFEGTELTLPDYRVSSVIAQCPQDILSVAADTDEIFVATDKHIRVFDHQANYLYSLEGHTANVNALVTEGDFLYSASDDKTVAIWDKVNEQLVTRFEAHSDAVLSVALDVQYIYTTSADNTVKVWTKKGELMNTLAGHTGAVTCIFLDEKYIYSGSVDKTIKVWHKNNGELVRELTFHSDAIRSIVVDDSYLYSASDDKTLTIWNKQDYVDVDFSIMKELPSASAPYKLAMVNGVLYVGYRDGYVQMMNVDKNFSSKRSSLCAEYDTSSAPRVNSFFVQNTGVLYAILGSEKQLQVWKPVWRSASIDTPTNLAEKTLHDSIEAEVLISRPTNLNASAEDLMLRNSAILKKPSLQKFQEEPSLFDSIDAVVPNKPIDPKKPSVATNQLTTPSPAVGKGPNGRALLLRSASGKNLKPGIEQETSLGYIQDESEAQIAPLWHITRPERATEFLFVPFTLERMIMYGMIICMDSFLFVFTLLPIRFVLAAMQLLRNPQRLAYIQKLDLLRTVLILLGFFVVCSFDTSEWGQFVKSSSMKLKMVWMCLEFMDKVMTSYGEHLLGALFWAVSVPPEQVVRGRWWHFLVSWGYVVAHATFLLIHISVINIAVHEGNKSLLALLLLVQFAEMKGAVMKTTPKLKLYAMCYDDICERFQLLIYVTWILLFNIVKGSYSLFAAGISLPALYAFWGVYGDMITSAAIVYLSELVVDWSKHSTIASNNDISPSFYTRTTARIATDLAKSPATSILTDRSFAVSKKMGLFSIPLAVVVLKLIHDWVAEEGFSWDGDFPRILLAFAILFVAKKLNGMVLDWFILRYKDKPVFNLERYEKPKAASE